MASAIISSFITNGGVPAIGLNLTGFPKIRITERSAVVTILIVGAPDGTGSPQDEMMIATTDDGFYSFIFSDLIGYDTTKNYLIRVDAGPSIPVGERFQVTEITPAVPPDDVATIATATATAAAAEVWEQSIADLQVPGTAGSLLSAIRADTAAIVNNLYLDQDSVHDLVRLLLKFETGRTRINTANHTLTVYDDNCTTPLRVFKLLDTNGQPSVTEVCERKPISSSDGLPICP